jgi:hypothetical protein
MSETEHDVTPCPALNPLLTIGLVFALTACSQSDGASNGRLGEEITSYRLVGTVATGRAGAWAEVCVESDCSRANDQGVYRLLGERQRPALITADIPNSGQTVTRLNSLYRHQPEQTVALVNINPSTDALLDSWSRYQLSQSLADCSASTACVLSLTDGFNEQRQQSAERQLRSWLAPVWETERSPFSDPYFANPDSDWLDKLHDYITLRATDSGLNATDNDGNVLATLAFATLFDSDASLLALSETDLAAAYEIPRTIPVSNNPITITYQATPSSPFTTPVDWQANVSSSQSLVAGALSFQHTLVAPDGRVTLGSDALFSVSLTEPGPYTWTVVATDTQGNRETTGLSLQASADDIITNPSFGAEGSCYTAPLTNNASNICISTVDGGSLGACVAGNSGSTQTRYSPAPCSPVSQQGGVFLATCTSVLNQIRIYHYDNPLRNTSETLEEQSERLRLQCINDLGRDWAAEPPE